MKLLILILFISLGFQFVNAQQPISQFKNYNCEKIKAATDFETALDAGKTYKIDLLCSPLGRGESNEVNGSGKYYFEEEHNVVWIKFTAIKTSKLAVKINPKSKEDDYDFLIFKDEGKQTKSNIRSKRQKPIRSNLARTMEIDEGKTGLKFDVEKTHIGFGPNPSFSKYIDVEAGESFYLILDNVYGGDAGAEILFDYFKTKTIHGVISDENKKAIEAEVVWENSTTGEELVVTTSDAITGEFEMEIPFNINPTNQYVLSAFSDEHFFAEVTYTPQEIATCEPLPIQVVLPFFDKGKHTKLQNINFIGGKAIFLESAKPSLKRLARLMKKNPNLIIKIEGHTNGCANGYNSTQILSENRATAVQDYLTIKGIEQSRISTVGHSCKYMLYAIDSAPKYQSLNRRVEIVVEDY